MKAYIFKMNGNITTLDNIKNCLPYELDWYELFNLGGIECDDCSSDNSIDIITVEEIELAEKEKTNE